MRLADLKVVIGFSKGGLRELNADLKKTRGRFARDFGAVADMAKSLAMAITGTLVAAIGTLIKKGAEMETLRTGFISVAGSANKAAAIVAELNEFAAKTPFQLEEISSAARKLLATGTRRSELQKELKMLGDIAASSGNSIDDIAAIFAKVQAKGKVELESLNQLAERNIGIFDELRRATGDANMEFGAGKVSVEDFNKALRGMVEEGGLAAGAMENLSETVQGRITTMLDNLGLEMAAFAERLGLTDAFGSLLENATEAMQGVGGVVQSDVSAALGKAEEAMESFANVSTDNLEEVEQGMADAAADIQAVMDELASGAQTRVTGATLMGLITGDKDAGIESLQEVARLAAALKAVQDELLTASVNLNQAVMDGAVAGGESNDVAEETLEQFEARLEASAAAREEEERLTEATFQHMVTSQELAESLQTLRDVYGELSGVIEEVTVDVEEMFDEGEEERIAAMERHLKKVAFAAENIGGAFATTSTLVDAAFANMRDKSQGFHLALRDMLVSLLQKAIALAAAFAAMSVFMGGTATVKALGSFKQFMLGGLGVPQFANGGLVSGMTLGVIGEGPGTSAINPEVVAPLDKLRDMLGGQQMQISGILRGSDILLSNERALIDRNRLRAF